MDQRNAAALVRSQGEAVAAARRALAAIPMPADGDPLLTEMEAALVALRAANGKFQRRFRHIEQALREAGRPIENCSLEELDALWGEAKKLEKLQPGC